MAETVKLGKVSMTLGGEYNPSKSYEKLTCVYYNHGSWMSRKEVPEGVIPSEENSAFWQKVSDRGAKGDTGPRGEVGSTGERGPQGNSGYQGAAGELEVVNDLTSGGEASALSAEQGKILDGKLTELRAHVLDFTIYEINNAIEKNGGVIDRVINQTPIINALKNNTLIVIPIGAYSDGYCVVHGELDGAGTLSIEFDYARFHYSVYIESEVIEADKEKIGYNIVIDKELSSTSTNPVQNKVIESKFSSVSAENERLKEWTEEQLGNINAKPMVSVTYAELVALRDNGELVAGMQYRITDYVTTTAQGNTRSAGHQFDVIVTADNENTLNEVARACLHEGDTYFSEAGANLAAWKIWYCLDNDTERFAWAVKGGVKLICDEDSFYVTSETFEFKNQTYYKVNSRYNTAYVKLNYNVGDTVFTLMNLNGPVGTIVNLNGSIVEDSNGFTLQVDTSNIVTINSKQYHPTNSTGWFVPVNFKVGDEILEYYTDIDLQYVIKEIEVLEDGKGVIYRMIDEWNNDCPYDFKNIMFVRYELEAPEEYIAEGNYSLWMQQLCNNVRAMFDEGVRSFVWAGIADEDKYWEDDMSQILSHTTGENFAFFTFNTDEDTDASLSGGIHDNKMTHSQTLPNNVFFGNDCYYNSFGNGCYYNSFGNDCYSNSFGNDCYSNGFGNDCYSNSFGNDCYYNSFGDACRYNSFGNDCVGVELSEGTSHQTASVNSNSEVKVFNLADLADLANL